MADNTVAITAGSGTSIRTVTNAGVDGGAHQQVITLGDSAGNLIGTTAAPFPVSSVADVATSGTMAATSATVALATGGRGTTAIEITGTWVGTISFQATSDPSGTAATSANWYAVNAPAPTVAVPASSTAANGLYRVNSSGYTAVRVIMTAYTSGTATAWMNAAAQASMVTLAEPITTGADPDTIVTGTITATDAVVAAPTGNGALLTGAPTAGSFVQVACPGGDSSWDIQISGTFGGGTVYFEASFDSGTTWLPVNGRQTGVINTVLGYSTTTAGAYRGNTSGASNIRARIVGATAPSVATTLRVSSGIGAVFLNASIPAGTNNIGTVGLAAGTAYAGQVRLTDGTNNPAVKAASTAVVATDPSLAVALHPSSPLPAGTSTVGNVGWASNVVAAGSLGVLNATYEGTIDCSIYSSVRLSITGTWVGTITFQVSNDQATWVGRALIGVGATSNPTTTSGNGQWSGEIGGRYFRVVMTSYTSGTAVPIIVYSAAPASAEAVGLASGNTLVGSVGIGGITPLAFSTTSAASTNATSVKTTAGNLQEVTVSNPTATAAYFKLYNKASAPTVGTDVPIATYRVAATGSAGDTVQLSFGPNGKRFATGIAWALTGAAVSTDATAAVAGVLISGTYI